MCHISGVKCHVAVVTRQVLDVTNHISFLQRGGASQWRVCYQGGLSHLVLRYSQVLISVSSFPDTPYWPLPCSTKATGVLEERMLPGGSSHGRLIEL